MTWSRQQRQKDQMASITVIEARSVEDAFLRNMTDAWELAQQLFKDADSVMIQAFRMQDPITYLRGKVAA